MPCPLLNHIAITADNALADNLAGPAVRLRGYRGHDIVILNPAYSLWERIEALGEVVRSYERKMLVYGMRCECEPLAIRSSA